jgi:diguanylate cyclase (GGDEF)-like protein/PAS domain S-box-containing protein
LNKHYALFKGVKLQRALLIITVFFLPSVIFAQTSSIEKVDLQLGWKHQFQYAGFYIAKEYGFYQEVDLNVNIKEFDHSVDIVNEVVSGHTNFGVGKSSLLIERHNGKPVVALAALYQSSPSVLVTTNPAFKTLKDIRSKKIMVTEDAVRSASINSMLLSSGISGNDFVLQKHSFNLNDLIEGKTDAMASYLSNEIFYLEKKNIPYQVFNPKDYGYDFYGDILFTSNNEIINYPKRVRKFYTASKKGWLWAFENIEKTAQLIYDKYNTQNKSLESLIYEGQVLKKLALIKGIDFGHLSIKKFNKIAEVFRLGNMLDKESSLNAFVDPLNLNRTQVKIGVLATRDIEATLKRWVPLTHYLNTKLDSYYFTVVPLDFDQLGVSVANNEIDFFIANPLYYVQLEHLYGVSRIATLLNKNSATQDMHSEFGGVIFTKHDNKRINRLEDIKGKSFAAVDKISFGGWVMAYEELINHGMTQNDIKLTFLKTHDAVVNAVLKGHVESGTIRTDTLEGMVDEGKIKLSDIKVINLKDHKNFPYLASTKLYPEWPFSKLKDTPFKLADDVLSALLYISPEHELYKEIKADEWTAPLDYNAVHTLLKKLHISPYDFHEISLVDVAKKYSLLIYTLVLGFVLLIFRLAYINKLNKTLDGYNLKLDQEVKERTVNLEKANKELKLAASVFANAREGIFITDANGIIIEVNETFSAITGYSREEIIGQNPRILQSGIQSTEFYSSMWKSLLEKEHWYGEIWNRDKSGKFYAELLTISAVKSSAGQVQNYVALFSDITVMKNHQSQLEHIVHYDVLTNLPNRVLLADRLNQAIAGSQRSHNSLAVVFLDLDGFKAVNDTHGHNVGDELLIMVAKLMKDALRDGDTLARIGGDEFIAVLPNLDKNEDYQQVLDRLLLAASEIVTIGGIELQVSTSIGVTLYPQDGADADILMRHADQAMYQAKQAGKNCYHLFDTEHDEAVNFRQESINNISAALDKGEFVLYYQPKVNMLTGEIVGVEALIRWQHPLRGLLTPIDFLPITEDHAISIEIGEWVIDTALKQISHWQKIGFTLPISINISAYQLQQSNFVTRFTTLLAAHKDVSPHDLELEILETSVLEDVQHISSIMNACIALGTNFSLDDFGTGYSSLTHLRRLPANLIKIDQTFVRDMSHDADDLAIVKGVIALAKSFKRDVIAEGVETIDHGNTLLQLGCDLAQGYGIARPMPASDIPTWINDWKPDVSWQI